MPRTILSFLALNLGALFCCALQAAQPQLISLTPTTGLGLNQTFVITASDSAGASDIAGINLVIASSFNGPDSCWIYFDLQAFRVHLNGDTGWDTPSSSCQIKSAFNLNSGNNTTASLTVQFAPSWTGVRTVWARAGDKAGADSGYRQLGTYTVSTAASPDFSVSTAPISQSIVAGSSTQFALTLKALNGYTGTISVRAELSGSDGSHIHPVIPAPFALPASPETASTPVSVSLGVDTDAFATPEIVNMLIYLSDTNNLTHIVPVELVVEAPDTPNISLTPDSGSGPSPVFTVVVTDPAGFQAIGGVNFLMNSSFTGVSGCWLSYTPDSNTADGSGTLALASDDTAAWPQVNIGPQTGSGPLANSQCSFAADSITATGTGNTLTLHLAPQFSPSFTGVKNTYVNASNKNGPASGYSQPGTWTATSLSSAPDYRLDVTPSSQNVSGTGTATYSAAVTPFNGFAGAVDLTVAGMPPGSTLAPPAAATPGIPSQFSIAIDNSVPLGTYPIVIQARNGSLTHSTLVVLNVQSAIPIIAPGPAGYGQRSDFTFSVSDPGGAANLTGLNVLFNSSVDGQHACWINFDGTAVRLANDDASTWTIIPGGTNSIGNSQCNATFLSNRSDSTHLEFTVILGFSNSFAGMKNVYEYAANKEGGETGYQLKGTWVVPLVF